MTLKAVFSALLLGAVQAAFALEPGAQAPEIAPAKFLSGTPFKLSDLKGKSPCLVEFFASWSDDGLDALRNLNRLKKEFAARKLEVLAISSEEEKDLLPALAKQPASKLIPVAIDDKGSADAAYMSSEPLTPSFFLIGTDGQLIWKGQASDLNFAVKRYFSGKFAADDAKRVSSLRKDLSEALASKSLNKAIEASDEILKILPADSEVIRLRLAMYEAQGNRKQAHDFLDRLLESAPDAESLYFEKLALLLHSDPKAKSEELARFAAKAAEALKGNAEALNNLAWILIDETEFADAPLAIALKASEDSLALLPKGCDDPEMRAASLDTLARLYASVGRLEKAAELQAEALEIWKGTDDEERCAKVLNYYKTAYELGKGASAK